jgi:hypothetical protein
LPAFALLYRENQEPFAISFGDQRCPSSGSPPDRANTAGQTSTSRTTMNDDDNLFSHPAEAEYKATDREDTTEPTQMPVFSHRDK